MCRVARRMLEKIQFSNNEAVAEDCMRELNVYCTEHKGNSEACGEYLFCLEEYNSIMQNKNHTI